MKPDEPIQTGMLVWHASGRTARVVSVIVAVGQQREDGSMDWTPRTEVRIASESNGATENVPLDKFMEHYHRRLTAWERLDFVNIEVPAYLGYLKGHHVIELGYGNGKVFRIADRPRMTREQYQAEHDDIIMRHDAGTRCD